MSVLDAPPETVWEHVLRPATLARVSRKLLTFRPVSPPAFPEVWKEGDYRVLMLGFGWFPLGRQLVAIELQDVTEGKHLLRDHGRGQWLRRWDHLLTVEPAGGGKTRFTDFISFDAGLLTPLFARLISEYFAHRHRRWEELVRRGFA